MVRLVAFDLKEKSEYSQNLLKMFAIFVDITPEVVVRVSLMHPIVHVAEPNSIPALSKQRSLQQAEITSTSRDACVFISLARGRTDRKYLAQIQLHQSQSSPWFLCLRRNSKVVWIAKNNLRPSLAKISQENGFKPCGSAVSTVFLEGRFLDKLPRKKIGGVEIAYHLSKSLDLLS